MRIGRETAALTQLLPEVVQVFCIDSSFEECPCVDAGHAVPLEVHHIGWLAVIAAAEEVVKRNLVEGRGRCVGGDMSAKTAVQAIGINHHRHRVPACIALDAPLDVAVTGIGRFFFGRNGVNIRGSDRGRDIHPRVSQARGKFAQEQWGCRAVSLLEDRFENELKCVEPFLLFYAAVSVAVLRKSLVFFIFSFHVPSRLIRQRTVPRGWPAQLQDGP